MRILYIVYWGAAEPLGRSLVLPAMRGLAQAGLELTLVTFEKPADLASTDVMSAVRSDLESSHVRWTPLRYHKRPKWPATASDIALGVAAAVSARRYGKVDVVHARTLIGGVIGLAAARLLRAKLVFHNEGFYADEQVDGGIWREGSTAHRLARRIEDRLYGSADAIITLSERARVVVEQLPRVRERRPPVAVVPSAVDLDKFTCRGPVGDEASREVRLVYSGSVGARYLLDGIGRFVAEVARQASVSLRVLSGAPRSLVAELLTRGGLAPDRWSLACLPHAEMPDELKRHHAGLHFLPRGLSEHAGSPTKFGEYWASGLPVITTPNVSDSEEIITRERVGVLIREHSESGYERAARELIELLRDPELQARCRRAAEVHYGLEQACRRQLDLYQALARGTRRVE